MVVDQWIRGPSEFEKWLSLKVILNYTSLNSLYYQQNSSFNIFYIISLNLLEFRTNFQVAISMIIQKRE